MTPIELILTYPQWYGLIGSGLTYLIINDYTEPSELVVGAFSGILWPITLSLLLWKKVFVLCGKR